MSLTHAPTAQPTTGTSSEGYEFITSSDISTTITSGTSTDNYFNPGYKLSITAETIITANSAQIVSLLENVGKSVVYTTDWIVECSDCGSIDDFWGLNGTSANDLSSDLFLEYITTVKYIYRKQHFSTKNRKIISIK